MTTSGDWQCEKTLVECLKYMLTSEIASDVTFLLGEGREVVHTHKFILISRSPVFYAMFEGPMSEKGEVTVPDIPKNIFLDFLGYLYTDQISLNPQNAIHVLYAAKKYCVDCLTKQCVEYFKSTVSTDNVCVFLEQAHMFGEEKLAADCRNVIKNKPEESLQSLSFTLLCQSCVQSITESDDLEISEDLVYEAVMRWSEAECGRQKLEVTDANRRQVLGEVLHSIRFPIMDSEYFIKEVLKRYLLTADEIVAVQRLQNKFIIESEIKFKTVNRKLPLWRIERFSSRGSNWNHNGNSDAISFKVSKPVCFHGIGMYGCSSGTANYSLNLELFDSKMVLMSSTKQLITTDQTKDIYDVTLDAPKNLQADTVYTIIATMIGKCVNRGLGGEALVQKHEIDITFLRSDKSKNGTDIQSGQIPRLILSQK